MWSYNNTVLWVSKESQAWSCCFRKFCFLNILWWEIFWMNIYEWENIINLYTMFEDWIHNIINILRLGCFISLHRQQMLWGVKSSRGASAERTRCSLAASLLHVSPAPCSWLVLRAAWNCDIKTLKLWEPWTRHLWTM